MRLGFKAMLPRGARWRHAATVGAGALVCYVGLAYLLLPYEWLRRERLLDPSRIPFVTRTAQGIPGDPLNIGVVGSREELLRAMAAAGWSSADPVTLRSSLEIAGSVLLDRPYRDAPVSPLFYQGRREDLAFEKLAGRSADSRQHVRFWRAEKDEAGRAVWLGSATFDRGVGFSHYTGAITHHIAADIDAERDALVGDLTVARLIEQSYAAPGRGATTAGRNGEGDPYFTDGEMRVLVLKGAGAANAPR